MTNIGNRVDKVPDGDDKPRSTCADCGHVDYNNPKPACFAVATYGDKILLVRRDINPGKGLWALPGGHQEKGETKKAASLREAFEEANARIDVGTMIGEYEALHANVTMTVYRAKLLNSAEVKAMAETQEVGIFAWDEIPWDELAFPMVKMTLDFWKKTKDREDFAPQQIVLTPPSMHASP